MPEIGGDLSSKVEICEEHYKDRYDFSTMAILILVYSIPQKVHALNVHHIIQYENDYIHM